MDIELHNTLSGKKEKFVPLRHGLFGKPEVGMYHCGPTVYNYIHIGNVRAFFLADTVRRVFEANGYKVNQVMNITDIGMLENDNAEDKMTLALKREGKPLTLEAMRELADFYTKAFVADLKAFNIQIPHKLPLASEHIEEDIEIIRKLEKKGLTYKIIDGIYFDISKINDYAKLGGVGETNEIKSRIGMNIEKRNVRDFALWKFNENLGWRSPWGKGFPGWHIECSAMSMKYLGETFDIHTGGVDLIPIHHNNEIAQSEHATSKQFARYWLHNAFVNVGTEKMAKSAGNFITLKSLKEQGYNELAYRYFLLQGHYSTPLNFSDYSMESSSTSYKRLRNLVSEMPPGGKICKKQADLAIKYMSHDLDTPATLALVWDILKMNDIIPADKKATIIEIDEMLGLKLGERIMKTEEISQQVKNLVQNRESARDEKDWARADALRDQIEVLGYNIKDTPAGQKIEKR